MAGSPGGGRRPVERLLTLQEVAEHMGVSVRSVRRLVDEGELPVIRIRTRLVRVSWAAFRDFLNRF